MKLCTLLENLALGELQGTSLVDTKGFTINPIFLPKLLSVINRSLEHFYSVFVLKKSGLIIELHEGISDYYLSSKYAESNHDNDNVKYIMDNDLKPFSNDIVKILSIQTLDGRNLDIDDVHSTFGVLLSEYNCITVPYNLGVKHLSVHYQACHESINLHEPANSEMDINIPIPMLSAFMAYVACLFTQNLGGTSHQESNAFFAKYKTQMEMLQLQGIGVNPQTGINIKPYINNWI